ncbi:MAG: Holliday junction branch migration protein RuvA [Oscillospiraceae bacterium]|nr:Holliday junction branch migration protein RuvA [Oscillospiraceae bacterium]
MLYYLIGTVSEIGQNSIILEVGGIGFQVNTSLQTISDVKTGSQVKLYISESIGENNYDLYGFSEQREKRFFELLVSISGVGPKAAISVLSVMNTDELVHAVMTDDIKALTAAPGIGKKIAQRILLELRDKLGAELPNLASSISDSVKQPGKLPSENQAIFDAMAGLSVLGYSSAEVSAIIRRSDWTGMTAEQIIREVLKNMV